MHTTHLRRVGGSIMLSVPPTILELLQLKPGAEVALRVDSGRLVIEPRPRPRYTLEELLAQSDFSLPASTEERAWIDAPARGGELL